MQIPQQWGVPTTTPGIYAIGGGDWVITWSPTLIHPYALQWLQWASTFGPDWQTAPPADLWFHALRTKERRFD